MRGSSRRKKRQALENQALFVSRSQREISQLTEKGRGIVSRHQAKGDGKKSFRAQREAQFTSGFKGDVEVGKYRPCIIQVTARAWVMKKPNK